MLNLNFISNLNQFVNHKVEISTRGLRITFNYQDFNYEVTEEDLILMDVSDKDCGVYIPVGEIVEVTNLTDDLYTTVVDIKYGDKILSICCAERKPIPVRCDRCGKEILIPEETIWYIHGQANYGSYYDDPEENSIVNSLSFCDNCIAGFVGKIGEQDE